MIYIKDYNTYFKEWMELVTQELGFLIFTALYKVIWAGALWQGNVSRDLTNWE